MNALQPHRRFFCAGGFDQARADIAAKAQVLKEGDLLAIFLEGGITRDGSLQEFKGGIMKILERQSAPVQ